MKLFSRLLNRTRGAKFEALAQHFLECQGYQLITKNYGSYRGEIDLIMQHDQQLAFIEVRYRQSTHYGSPLDSIDCAKQRRIIDTVETFLKRNPRFRAYAYRFDAVLIGPDYLHWLKNVF